MALYGDWNKVHRNLRTLEARLHRKLNRVVGISARELAKYWKEGIKEKSFGLQKNADLTIEAKQSSTPLVDHGDLIGSIKPKKMKIEGNLWFVGILKNAKTKDGKSLADIASVMEYGSDGKITPKEATYLAIPLTRKASRAGSPRNYPGHLIFLRNPNTMGAVFVDFESEEVQYILLEWVEIPPRPSRKKALKGYARKYRANMKQAIKEELRGGPHV